MANPEFEEICAKAEKIGIKISVIMEEIDRRIKANSSAIAREVVDQIPLAKPNIDEIVRQIKEKLPSGQVDVRDVAQEILKLLPDQQVIEAEAIKQQVIKELSQSLSDVVKEIDRKMETEVRGLIDKVLMEEKDNMTRQVLGELEKRQDKMIEGAKESAGKNGKWAGVPWGEILPVVKDLVKEGPDPLAGLDYIISLRDKLSLLQPQGGAIDPAQQFRTSSASFLEGVKVGAKAGLPVKKSSSPPGGQLNSPGRSSRLNPIIESL